jgi:DNA-binding transcriptional LysR family regulator
MQRGRLDQLVAFVAVARERSLTNAASKLGVSQSVLSHTIRQLEERLGVRLTRTTGSVPATEGGERLLGNIGPRFDEIEAEVAAERELREKHVGSIRSPRPSSPSIRSCCRNLRRCSAIIPTSKVEMIVDYGLTDIVAQQYDAGIRGGERVAKDMIVVRIGPDMRMAVVGAPSYFKIRPEPGKPQDLIGHSCINLRLPTRGSPVRPGVREGHPRTQGPRGRATHLQRHGTAAQCSPGRMRPRLCS